MFPFIGITSARNICILGCFVVLHVVGFGGPYLEPKLLLLSLIYLNNVGLLCTTIFQTLPTTN